MVQTTPLPRLDARIGIRRLQPLLDVPGQPLRLAGQVALDFHHQLPLLGQHDEAAVRAGQAQQPIQGALQQLVQVHLAGEQGGGLQDGLEVVRVAGVAVHGVLVS